MAAYIYLTQTYLDLEKVSQLIGRKFDQTGRIDNLEMPDLQNLENLNSTWDHLKAGKRVLEYSFESKDDFRDALLKLYEVYPEPTLLFLGDLSSYSTQLQEGMLRLLEEPPQNLNVILFAQSRSEVLATISSRARFLTLPISVIMGSLSSTLMTKVKEKLPSPAEYSKVLIQSMQVGKAELPDVSKVEREELDFWLWQLQAYFTKFYEQKSSDAYATLIGRILKARLLSSQNLQKKIALSQILLPLTA